jgi:hypothetical protein
MPRKIGSNVKEECCMHKGRLVVSLGGLVFLIGVMRYYQFDWSVVLMVAGILILLKGIYIKMKK